MKAESVETGGTVKERIREAGCELFEPGCREEWPDDDYPWCPRCLALAEIERLEGALHEIERNAGRLISPGAPYFHSSVEAASKRATALRTIQDIARRALSDSKGGA